MMSDWVNHPALRVLLRCHYNMCDEAIDQLFLTEEGRKNANAIMNAFMSNLERKLNALPPSDSGVDTDTDTGVNAGVNAGVDTGAGD